jgi:hypothetical protein
MACDFCAFAERWPGLPASYNEPAEPDTYTCVITGEGYPEGQTPQDCPDFAWCQELDPIKVSDVYL